MGVIKAKEYLCVFLLVCCPGSAAIKAGFFRDESEFLDQMITFIDTIVAAGYFDVPLVRTDISVGPQSSDFSSRSPALTDTLRNQHPTVTALVVLAMSNDEQPPVIDILRVGLAEHPLSQRSILLHPRSQTILV
jgi:hypothetical protein